MNDRNARRTDIAVWAPLVLLPFAWFITGACTEFIDGTGDDPYAYDPNYVAPSVYSIPGGETRFVGPGGSGTDIYCVGGTYRSGGAGSSDSIKNGLRREIGDAKNKAKSYEDRANACRGRIRSASDYDSEIGCNRGRLRELGGLVLAATSAAEAQQLQQEQGAMGAKCDAAQSRYALDDCADHNVQDNYDVARRWRAEAAHKESQLQQFEACDADRQRRARAQRPGIDPAIILMNPGLFGPRPGHGRPSGGHGTGTHKE